ncbi:MAG: acetate--CoA ligase [Dehalococcoidia bacterium]|nr:acetate--CoA ligase [Dehalococcoidia bacterium]
MDYAEIVKEVGSLRAPPNLDDYERTRREWSWDRVRADLGLRDDFVNQAYQCIDRHVYDGRGEKTAMIWEGADGAIERYTFEDMRRQTNRFANVLRKLGVRKADRVFIFADRIPELYFALFGVLKVGAIGAPLFSAFGPEPVAERVKRAEGMMIITTPALLPKVNAIRGDLPSLKHVMVIGHRAAVTAAEGDLDYGALMAEASDEFEIERTGAEDWSIMHFTSGTTGLPKGAAHVHGAVVGHYATGKYALDLHPDDVFWCTADPGWVTGTSYGMFAPWSNGVTQVIYEGGFGATRWYDIIQRHRVTVWYTAPTAIRMLMKGGSRIAKQRDLSSLRYMMSVGEPLAPAGVVWGVEAIGLPFHDNWWQTETGAVMITNFPALPIRPGSMGLAFPGIEAAIIDDEFQEITQPMQEGQLALRPGGPSMFRTYWQDEERYNSRFKGGWYLTGDRAKRDADGYFWFIGRDDDVINTAGHLVGPFEVESALIAHPAVAEAGVIGKPDAMAMEIVKAFVALKDGYEPSEELRRELIGHARQRLGPGVAPREIEFVSSLPKTRSGKIMRRLLKARELGLPEGDTSTLEED